MARINRVFQECVDLAAETVGRLNRPGRKTDTVGAYAPMSPPPSLKNGGRDRGVSLGVDGDRLAHPDPSIFHSRAFSRRAALITTAGGASAAASLPFVLSANRGRAENLLGTLSAQDIKALEDPERIRQRFIETFLEIAEYKDIESDHAWADEFATLPSGTSTGDDTAPLANLAAGDQRLSLFDREPSRASLSRQKPILAQNFDSFSRAAADSSNPYVNEFSGATSGPGSLANTLPATTKTALADEELLDHSNTLASVADTLGHIGETGSGMVTEPGAGSATMDAAIATTAPDFVPFNAPLPRTRRSVNTPNYIALAPLAQEAEAPFAAARPTSRIATSDRRSGQLRASSFNPLPGVVTSDPQDRTLLVRNIHTGDRLRAKFFSNGSLDAGALNELRHLFRDRRDGTTHQIDPTLYDQIFSVIAMNGQSAAHTQVNIVSGYRSPQTNAMLRAKSSGVAKNSYHMQGRAADMYIEGIDLSDLHVTALRMKRGGVGYYPSSNFVHLDTGPVRNWPASYRALGERIRNSA